MAKVIGPRFILKGFEPPDVKAAPNAQRRAYWEAVSAFVAEAKESELKARLDRYGNPMAPLAESTIRNRHSEMGPADPHGPQLQPAHGLSRTRALFVAQPTRLLDGVTCFWSYDEHTGESWGEILRKHRRGGGNLPVRDVIGLSPVSLETVRTRALHWWRSYIQGASEIPKPTKELMPTPAPKFLVQREPANAPPFAAKRVSQIRINEKTYTFQSASAAKVRDAIGMGKFSGFHSAAEVKAEAARLGTTRDPITGRPIFSFGPKLRPPPAPIPPRPPAPPLPPTPKPKPPAAPRVESRPAPVARKGMGARMIPVSLRAAAAWLKRKLFGARSDG